MKLKKLIIILFILLISTCLFAGTGTRTWTRTGGGGSSATGCNTTVGVMDADESTTGDLWKRTEIPANHMSCNGTQIRIQVECNSGNDCIIDYAGIGQRSGATEDYTGAGTRITWDTGSTSTTVTAGATKYSDWIPFTFTKTNSYLVHMQQQGFTVAERYRKTDDSSDWATVTGATIYYKLSGTGLGDESLTADVTPNSTSTKVDNLIGFEVQ